MIWSSKLSNCENTYKTILISLIYQIKPFIQSLPLCLPIGNMFQVPKDLWDGGTRKLIFFYFKRNKLVYSICINGHNCLMHDNRTIRVAYWQFPSIFYIYYVQVKLYGNICFPKRSGQCASNHSVCCLVKN